MSAATALKKISARVKALKKKHPGKKYKTLQKQAGAEYRAGKLKARRKPAAKKKTARRKIGKPTTAVQVYSLGKLVRRKSKSTPKSKRVYKARRVKVKAYKANRYRRVSGSGSSMMPLLLVGGLAAAAYFLLKPAAPAQQLYQSNNPVRNSSANNILLYATAAGMTAKAIADLIAAINNSSDAEVTAAGANPGSVDLSKLRPAAGSISW